MNIVDEKLTGAEMIGRLRKGHMVRRACWVDDYFIRICNEAGYDENGNAIVGRGQMYTIATSGYFMHLAYSGQPMRKPRVFSHGGHWEIATRDSEGVAMLFADDWEDYGFIGLEDFNNLEKDTRELVRQNIKQSHGKAIEKAENA